MTAWDVFCMGIRRLQLACSSPDQAGGQKGERKLGHLPSRSHKGLSHEFPELGFPGGLLVGPLLKQGENLRAHGPLAVAAPELGLDRI